MKITVSCKNNCDSIGKEISIKVVPGISLPISTTPEKVILPQSLVFSANGQNLKWYTSNSSIEPLLAAPIINTPGQYTFYVSQKIGICESPRLAITATLFSDLNITLQPKDFTNCNGNTTNFKIEAKGAGLITYLWQRKLPNETIFTDLNDDLPNISNSESNQLKVSSVGNNHNPDLTQYRCIIKDLYSEEISDTVTLFVNKLNGRLENQELCVTNLFQLDLNSLFKITGEPVSVHWQNRLGTGLPWDSLKNDGNIEGTESLKLLIKSLGPQHEGQYRCSVLFNSSTGTCIETTDLMTLKVGNFPQEPRQVDFEFCQDENDTDLVLYPPKDIDILWYTQPENGLAYKKQPEINTTVAGNQVLWYAYINDQGCESKKVLVPIKINPKPQLPVNTTPETVIEGETLIFKAEGDNIKWFTSRTGKTFTAENPKETKIGKHDYYVSQTSDKNCESDRLLIESKIIERFSIITQPLNVSNCDGNTSTFSVRVKGAENPSYQWQIFNTNLKIFENIAGENLRDLKVSDFGKSPYLNGSILRVLITDNLNTLISNEVKISVNSILVKPVDINVCQNTWLKAHDLFNLTQGKVKSLEIQKKSGSAYSTSFAFTDSNDSIKLDSAFINKYRLRFTFENQGTITCVRNTGDFNFSVNKEPDLPNVNHLEICQYQKLTDIKEQYLLPQVSFYKIDSTLLQNSDLGVPGNTQIYIKNKSEFGCESPFKKVSLKVNPAPDFNFSDTTLYQCNFTSTEKTILINGMKTFWTSDPLSALFTENFINVISQEEPQVFWAKIEGDNKCVGKLQKVNFKFENCFFDENKDTCIAVTQTNLNINNWNYFYDQSGKIFAAIHPQGQNLGIVSFDFSNSTEVFNSEVSGLDYYPRIFNLKTSRPYQKEIKIRFYFTEKQVEDYIQYKNANSNVSIINYEGPRPDCKVSNNSTENNYWLIGNTKWLDLDDFKYAEFSTLKTGEFALWFSSDPIGVLTGEKNSFGLPLLKIINTSPNGNYYINKSQDNINWFEWRSDIKEQIDNLPLFGDNFYELFYVFENGIRQRLNKVNIRLTEELKNCMIFENPSDKKNDINFYMYNLDKTSISISTLWGQQMVLDQLLVKNEHYQLRFIQPLTKGEYIISAKNLSGDICFSKFIVW
jgi:hypothetical protein